MRITYCPSSVDDRQEEEKDKEGEDEDDGVVVSRRTSGLLPEDRPCNWIERVFTLLEHPDYDRPAKIAGYVIMSVILLSSLAFIVGTLPRFRSVRQCNTLCVCMGTVSPHPFL